MTINSRTAWLLLGCLAAGVAMSIFAITRRSTQELEPVSPRTGPAESTQAAPAQGVDPNGTADGRSPVVESLDANSVDASQGTTAETAKVVEPTEGNISAQSFQEKYGSMTLDELEGARAVAEKRYLAKVDKVLTAMLERGEYVESILKVGEKQPQIESGMAYRATGSGLPGGQTLIHAAKFDPKMHSETAFALAEMQWLGQEVHSRSALAGKPPR